jgi:hypothetical protein
VDSRVERQNQAAHSRRADRNHLVEADNQGDHQAGRHREEHRVADRKPELHTRAVPAEARRIGAGQADQVEVHSQQVPVLVGMHLVLVLEENLLVDIRRDCLDLVGERRLSWSVQPIRSLSGLLQVPRIEGPGPYFADRILAVPSASMLMTTGGACLNGSNAASLVNTDIASPAFGPPCSVSSNSTTSLACAS